MHILFVIHNAACSVKIEICFGADGEHVLWMKDAKDFERRVRSASDYRKESELDQFGSV